MFRSAGIRLRSARILRMGQPKRGYPQILAEYFDNLRCSDKFTNFLFNFIFIYKRIFSNSEKQMKYKTLLRRDADLGRFSICRVKQMQPYRLSSWRIACLRKPLTEVPNKIAADEKQAAAIKHIYFLCFENKCRI